MKNIETQPGQNEFIVYRDGNVDKQWLYKRNTKRVLGFIANSAVFVASAALDGLDELMEAYSEKFN